MEELLPHQLTTLNHALLPPLSGGLLTASFRTNLLLLFTLHPSLIILLLEPNTSTQQAGSSGLQRTVGFSPEGDNFDILSRAPTVSRQVSLV